ncbi:MAG: DUF4097 family beta strand repeat protein [Vicinamibacteria bacterium]|nr:DUF4097 family beta strand repeat protein [Vicinamibacteria bacterium]
MRFLRRAFVLGALLLLGLGTEAAWQIRERVGYSSWTGWTVFGRFEGPSHSFEESRDLEAAAEVEIDNRFGAVAVRGTDAPVIVVRLRKQVFAADPQEAAKAAQAVRLVSDRSGDVLRLTAKVEGEASRRIGVATHFTVEVPRSARVRVRNEHGAAEAIAVAAADVETSHDAGRLEDVAGDARLAVRHGDAVARRVAGGLDLACRFGRASIEDAGVTRAVVEHGGLAAVRVAALDAEVEQGDTSAERVAGALGLRARHGNVDVREVGGAATVSVEIGSAAVVGAAQADVRVTHGRTRVERVSGKVFASATHDRVELEDVGGGAEVEVEHGGLQASRVRGGLVARVSGDDVAIDGVEGVLQVDSRRARVRVAPAAPLAETSIQSEHGSVVLTLPAGAGAQLDLDASQGEIEVDLPGFDASERTRSRVAGRVGAGGPTLRVASRHGDVTVRLPPAPEAQR